MFLAHGLLKVVVFTLPGTAMFFEPLGLPGFMAYSVTFAEIGGGTLVLNRTRITQVIGGKLAEA
ncbi:MAG: DoxX family membrane protein [Rhodospirillales bacterium]|nr:DoxX family membrane protein [Rhodospirillales bacterium]